MMLFDSGVLIALFTINDEHHDSATRLASSEKKISITESTLYETVNFIFKKNGPKKAVEALNVLIDSEVEIQNTYVNHLAKAGEIMLKYKSLSLNDAMIVAVLQDYELREVVSFDSDFDKVPSIKRIS